MVSEVDKRICVVIVNYKTANLVLNCIETLGGQLDDNLDYIVVVDNDSGDKSVDKIKEGVDQQGLTSLVTVIASSANNGFSAGNNIGIKAIKAKYYILANADTLFKLNAIKEFLFAAQKYPQAGLIGPRLEWPNGQAQISCFRFHSPLSELINTASTGIITRLLKKYVVPLEVQEKVTTPDWISFACVLIRKTVFEKIGYLDDKYFMYFEDVDFCRRAGKNHYTITNCPKSHVVHLRGQSSGMKKMQRKKRRLPAYYYYSRSRYFKKYYGNIGYLVSNVCWLAGRGISLLKEILLGKERGVPQYQFIDIWKSKQK